MENKKKNYQSFPTKEQAIQKLKHYCSYQERCHNEAVQKLWELKVSKQHHDEIIATLIEEDYLNEERFSRLYAGSKFRIKAWGRVKIKNALREKGISSYLLKVAMEEINENDYSATLKSLGEKKFISLRGEQHLIRQKKTFDYLMQKGFEPELIREFLSEIKGAKK